MNSDGTPCRTKLKWSLRMNSTCSGMGSAANRDAQMLRRAGDRRDERGVLRPVRHDVEQRMEEERHVEREVGDDAAAGNCGIAREVVGAEKSPLLCRHEQEQHERRGRVFNVEYACATSSTIATPEALSCAPL